MPLISITGDFGVKPAERAADLSVAATSAEEASPTAPQRSQMQEHHEIAGRMGMHAGHEGVAALDPVNEAVLAQEIERAIDRDRRRPRVRSGQAAP